MLRQKHSPFSAGRASAAARDAPTGYPLGFLPETLGDDPLKSCRKQQRDVDCRSFNADDMEIIWRYWVGHNIMILGKTTILWFSNFQVAKLDQS